MSTPSYPLFSAIKDPAMQQVYKFICERLTSIEDRITTLETEVLTHTDTTLDAGGKRLINVTKASDSTDAVTLGQMRDECRNIVKSMSGL